jgi:hypothetical protein
MMIHIRIAPSERVNAWRSGNPATPTHTAPMVVSQSRSRCSKRDTHFVELHEPRGLLPTLVFHGCEALIPPLEYVDR